VSQGYNSENVGYRSFKENRKYASKKKRKKSKYVIKCRLLTCRRLAVAYESVGYWRPDPWGGLQFAASKSHEMPDAIMPPGGAV